MDFKNTKKIYFLNKEVQKVYFGSSLEWSKSSRPIIFNAEWLKIIKNIKLINSEFNTENNELEIHPDKTTGKRDSYLAMTLNELKSNTKYTLSFTINTNLETALSGGIHLPNDYKAEAIYVDGRKSENIQYFGFFGNDGKEREIIYQFNSSTKIKISDQLQLRLASFAAKTEPFRVGIGNFKIQEGWKYDPT